MLRPRKERAHAWLQENAWNYDKGVLAEILEPIMGKGLIPADLNTWKVRRRQIVPGAPLPAASARGTCCSRPRLPCAHWALSRAAQPAGRLRGCVPLRLPGFHKAYLQASVEMFGRCTQRTVDKLAAAAHSAQASGQVW
jgi:hypothetical protein